MKTSRNSRLKGITLIEALIALAVVALGLLALVRLYGDLISVAGVSKARSEAVQLASTRIEELRRHAMTNACGDFLTDEFDATDSPTGANAFFTRRTGARLLPDPERYEVAVEVSWNDAKGEGHVVALSSEIGCDNPRLSIDVLDGSLPGGGQIALPTGKAQLGGTLLEGVESENVNVIAGTDVGDGTRTLIKGDTTQLVTANDEVLLTMETSTPGQGFSIISGKVYFDPNNLNFGTGQNAVYPPDVRMISSDNSVCTRVFTDGLDPGTGTSPTPTSPVQNMLFTDASPYRYFYYQCYVGEAWYGNVGVVRLDSAPLNHRLCIGDPEITEPASTAGNLFSRHPTLETVRKYRGYIGDETAGFTAVGIGVDPEADGITNDVYTGTIITAQNFLISRLTGNPTNSNCKAPMERNGTAYFAGSSGEFVCLSGSCPGGLKEGDPVTIVQGEIARTPSPNAESIDHFPMLDPLNWAIQVDDESAFNCTTSTPSPETASYQYACSIYRPGWTGFGNWSGGFTLPTNTQSNLCIGEGDLSGTGAVYATVEGAERKVVLTNVPIGIEGIILNLRIAKDPVCE